MASKDLITKFANADFPQREQSILGRSQVLTPQQECVADLLIDKIHI